MNLLSCFQTLEAQTKQPKSRRKLLSDLMVPYSIEHHELDVTASIGISIYPDDFEDAEALLKAADTAMSDAKQKGRNNYQFFRSDMNVHASERQSLESSLRHALERKEFVLHYQPKINLETGAITGAEALIRWLHPDRGLVPPAQFLPIAEECGLMVPIGQWVTRGMYASPSMDRRGFSGSARSGQHFRCRVPERWPTCRSESYPDVMFAWRHVILKLN